MSKEKFNDRYSIRANISEFTNDNICVEIYFSDNYKVGFYGEQKRTGFNKEKFAKLFDDNGIVRFNFNPQNVENIHPYIHNASVVGFNVESGVVIQIISSESEDDNVSGYHMEMITLTFTEEEKEEIQSGIAKALLANKS